MVSFCIQNKIPQSASFDKEKILRKWNNCEGGVWRNHYVWSSHNKLTTIFFRCQDPLSHRIIEKRRRDRMNNCLADLSRLIPTNYMKQVCRIILFYLIPLSAFYFKQKGFQPWHLPMKSLSPLNRNKQIIAQCTVGIFLFLNFILVSERNDFVVCRQFYLKTAIPTI